MPEAKRKMTVYLDPVVARATRVRAARADIPDSKVIEEALRSYLGLSVLDEAQSLGGLEESEAIELAYSELHASRHGE